jgi:hypothetical protein
MSSRDVHGEHAKAGGTSNNSPMVLLMSCVLCTEMVAADKDAIASHSKKIAAVPTVLPAAVLRQGGRTRLRPV